MEVPPVRSTAKTEAVFTKARTKKTASTRKHMLKLTRAASLPKRTKSMFGVFLKKLSIRKGFIASGFVVLSKTRRVTTTAVNIEMMTPAVRVIAKPRTGPVPTLKRMMPVTIVVMFESRIAVKARP